MHGVINVIHAVCLSSLCTHGTALLCTVVLFAATGVAASAFTRAGPVKDIRRKTCRLLEKEEAKREKLFCHLFFVAKK